MLVVLQRNLRIALDDRTADSGMLNLAAALVDLDRWTLRFPAKHFSAETHAFVTGVPALDVAAVSEDLPLKHTGTVAIRVQRRRAFGSSNFVGTSSNFDSVAAPEDSDHTPELLGRDGLCQKEHTQRDQLRLHVVFAARRTFTFSSGRLPAMPLCSCSLRERELHGLPARPPPVCLPTRFPSRLVVCLRKPSI